MSVTAGKAAAPADMEAVIEEYQADLYSVQGSMTWTGRSHASTARSVFSTMEETAEALQFEPLDQHGKVDYLLLRTKLGAELDEQALERRRLAELAELLPFREGLQALEEARWRLDPVDAEKAAARLALVPDQIKQLRERSTRARSQRQQKKAAEPKPAEKPGPRAVCQEKPPAPTPRRTPRRP